MIKTTCIGHLGQDAVVKSINGKTVINFSVAHSKKFKNAQGTEINETLWVNCSFWTERTAVSQYLKKGTQVFIEGEPSIDVYKNAQNQWVPQLRLRIESIQLLGGAKQADGNVPAANTPAPAAQGTDFPPVDDLPF